MVTGLLLGVDGSRLQVTVADHARSVAGLIGADWVELCTLRPGVGVIVDEEGWTNGKRPNPLATLLADELGRDGLDLVGPALLIGLTDDGFTDLPADVVDLAAGLRVVQDVAPL